MIQKRNLDAFEALFPGALRSQDTWLCIKLNRPGYMRLVLERIDGGSGNRTYSLAHYYTQNGDAMRDPEVTFEWIGDGLLRWSVENQRWEVAGELDSTDCNECGGETTLNEVMIEEVSP